MVVSTSTTVKVTEKSFVRLPVGCTDPLDERCPRERFDQLTHDLQRPGARGSLDRLDSRGSRRTLDFRRGNNSFLSGEASLV